jgi:hypothetical protein
MKIHLGVAAAIGVVGLSGAYAWAGPAAKFSATISKVEINLDCQSVPGCRDNQVDAIVATIKVPNKKELLVGVSAQIGITTETTVKGKLGGGGTATASGGVEVAVELCPVANVDPDTKACSDGRIAAEPGPITLNARSQQLEAILGGVIESCTDADGNGTIDVATECIVSDEMVRLLLDTLSAHHYNFVFPNVPTGEYSVIARFDADVSSQTQETDVEGDTLNEANAKLVVGPRVVTVQSVRATNNPDGVVFDLPLE